VDGGGLDGGQAATDFAAGALLVGLGFLEKKEKRFFCPVGFGADLTMLIE
jgi:hypothetical protein